MNHTRAQYRRTARVGTRLWTARRNTADREPMAAPWLPLETVDSLFDPFFLRNSDQQEFGIDLMACYFIVFHHGGKIDARSDGNNGTEFSLVFPVDPASRQPLEDEQAFLTKVLTNEALLESILAET